ncbi:hypothetical protein ACFYVL_00250 [Streptomyces sp. NPDC004111]|uniref:hypothetical protein n=1 Tax=Streptomyces sp. NPDC004111 TaxID=3364690 RepID=UPI0036CE36D5
MDYTPTNSSWLNRIEAQFTALRYFALDGTDCPARKTQDCMIRRYRARGGYDALPSSSAALGLGGRRAASFRPREKRFAMRSMLNAPGWIWR